MTEQILIVLVYSLTIVAKKTGDSLLRFILHHDHKLALDLYLLSWDLKITRALGLDRVFFSFFLWVYPRFQRHY